MFGLFKSKKSPVRQRLEALLVVRRTWLEWHIENGRRETVLVVEFAYDTEPDDEDAIAEIMSAAGATDPGESPPARIRIIPRMYD